MLKKNPGCPRCGAYLLQHPEEIARVQGWLKCPSCAYCRKDWWNKAEDLGPKDKGRHKDKK